ncbi:MAG: hypothetical protein QF404_04490 [Planctomycetota bacterium]|jgi:predicted amidophosphoribosyltransferase|nr:hypothetical protein [Planctomycetota bacterium]MDP6939747.1 hypothetical protein [Planctomycetota bacterium]
MLAVASDDAPAAISALRVQADSELDEAGRRSSSTVIDLEAEENTCPGCFGTIQQGATRCPECGLRVG